MTIVRVMDRCRRPVQGASIMVAPHTYIHREVPYNRIYFTGKTNLRGCIDIPHDDIPEGGLFLRIRKVPFLNHEEIVYLKGDTFKYLNKEGYCYDITVALDRHFKEDVKYAHMFPINAELYEPDLHERYDLPEGFGHGD